jgi:LysR family hydrogen peroxide-inducible transcriptional activator
MTLTQLNYIIAVDRCRNFAQAAKECFVTQPTLSMQIQKLEDYLQIVVFDRSKSPIAPTPLGAQVLEYARKVIQGSQALEELSKSLRGEISGEFLLGIIPTLAPHLLPLFIQKFSEIYPDVELKIFEEQTDIILKALKEGKMDAALLAGPVEDKEIHEEHLFYEPFHLFFSADHKLLDKKFIEEKDLNIKEAWLLKDGHCLRTQMLQLCQYRKMENSDHSVSFEAGSLETIINLVKSSRGFTILPELAVNNLSTRDQKFVRQFKSPKPVRQVILATGPLSVKKSTMEALMKVISKSIPEELVKKTSTMEVLSI